MEYLLSLALLVLNLIDYERDLGHFVFTAAGAVLFVALFYFVNRKTKNFLATCVVMMCYTWQISWINIFGDPTSNLQLPWFYILGAMMLAYAVFNIGKCMRRDYSVAMLILLGVFLIIFNYPLIISNSVSEGAKEYIMIGFYVVVLLIAYLFKDTVPRESYEHMKTAFIWANVTSSALLVFQYFMYVKLGVYCCLPSLHV